MSLIICCFYMQKQMLKRSFFVSNSTRVEHFLSNKSSQSSDQVFIITRQKQKLSRKKTPNYQVPFVYHNVFAQLNIFCFPSKYKYNNIIKYILRKIISRNTVSYHTNCFSQYFLPIKDKTTKGSEFQKSY